MSDCIFCKIINGEIPSYTIFEDSEFKVILDRYPANLGDILILPKTHSENIYDIDPETCGRLYALAARLSKPIKDALGFGGLNVLQNNGAISGQSINHFHVHLIGRWPEDKVNINWTPIDPTGAEFEAVTEKLKGALL